MAKPHTSHSPYSLEYLYSLEKEAEKSSKKERRSSHKEKLSRRSDDLPQPVKNLDDERTM